MADFTFGIAGKVLEQIASLTYQEVSLALSVRSDLIKLERTISSIKAVVLDADEEKQAGDHRLRAWLGQLKDVLNDADDVLDELQYRARQKEVMKRYGSTSKKVRQFFSASNPLAFHVQLAHKIKNIKERLDEIAADKEKFNLTKRLEDRHIMPWRRDITHSFVHPSKVIGRDDDKEEVIHLLMHSDARKNVNVISIVGIGGLGKTTLAKLAYNDKRVVSHFQLRAWVCVSEDFNVIRLIQEILGSAMGSINENLSVDQLQTCLRDLLKDKKLLVVLDDVWNEDRNKWIELEALLLDGCNGSKIIVTTRNQLVATIMGTTSTYNLGVLSQEKCFSLFVKLAFKEGEEEQHPNLLQIGKEIVRKCKGVPLAVRTLASLLYSKVDEGEWKFVRDHEIWHLEQNEGDILPALRLSYNHFPYHLKKCFAYCSLFRKDYEFKSVELIQFWMAQGILQSNGQQELEDVGELYIKELCSCSFFQDVDMKNFLYYTFKMHDIVHDLALSVAQDECLIVTKNLCSTVIEKSSVNGKARHLSFSYFNEDQEVPKHLKVMSGVRTVLFEWNTPRLFVETCILKYIYLRVLDLSCSSIEELSSSIGNLKHLRYLNLCDNPKIKVLPDSIFQLYNLQTLLLADCLGLVQLPKDIRNMISLRFLVVTTCESSLLANGGGSLNSLRTLVIVKCKNLICLFKGMDWHLPNLQILVVDRSPYLGSLSQSINHLTALKILIIRHCNELKLTEGENSQDFRLRLQKLHIRSLPKVAGLPQWLQGSADTLKHLKIEDCANFTAFPEWTEGANSQDFKLRLQKLHIRSLPMVAGLPQWLQGSADTLKRLKIEDCANFRALPDWLPSLTSLQVLEITDCPMLSTLPEGMQELIALRELRIENCPILTWKCRHERSKIAHVPQIHLGDPTPHKQLWRQSSHEFGDWHNKFHKDMYFDTARASRAFKSIKSD